MLRREARWLATRAGLADWARRRVTGFMPASRRKVIGFVSTPRLSMKLGAPTSARSPNSSFTTRSIQCAWRLPSARARRACRSTAGAGSPWLSSG